VSSKAVEINQNTIALIKTYKNVHSAFITQMCEHDLEADEDFFTKMNSESTRFIEIIGEECCTYFLDGMIKQCLIEIKKHGDKFIKDSLEKINKEFKC